MNRTLEGRVLVTGAAGMLGSQLLLTAPARAEAVGTDLVAARPENPAVAHPGVDLADPVAVARLLDRLAPLAGVIHGAAYTAVDQAEVEEERALLANAHVPGVVARACAERRVPLVHVSTDFVFDGAKRTPYTVDDVPAPVSAYGRTKLAGERAVLDAHPSGTAIVRTQWLYGPRGKHFPGTILDLASKKDELRVVDDQTGSPTSTLELAPALWDVLAARATGLYHAACEGTATWFAFASETLRLAGKSTRIVPCTTAEFPRPAKRPAYSVLDCSGLTRLRGRSLAPWREGLADFLAEVGLASGQGPQKAGKRT